MTRSKPKLGKKLLQALGARDQAPGPDDQLSIDRKRAFTLMAEAYGEVRATVLYVRRSSDDAYEVAPSLFAGRGGSKKKDDSGVEAKTSAAAVPAPAQAAPAAQAAPVGHPDSNPFTA